jgi:hypothetical protein
MPPPSSIRFFLKIPTQYPPCSPTPEPEARSEHGPYHPSPPVPAQETDVRRIPEESAIQASTVWIQGTEDSATRLLMQTRPTGQAACNADWPCAAGPAVSGPHYGLRYMHCHSAVIWHPPSSHLAIRGKISNTRDSFSAENRRNRRGAVVVIPRIQGNTTTYRQCWLAKTGDSMTAPCSVTGL